MKTYVTLYSSKGFTEKFDLKTCLILLKLGMVEHYSTIVENNGVEFIFSTPQNPELPNASFTYKNYGNSLTEEQENTLSKELTYNSDATYIEELLKN